MKSIESSRSVVDAANSIVAALESRGIRLFSRIDHADAARRVGLELPDEELLVFGDPRAGTGLMREDPRVGIELPLKLLVWDAHGTTRVGWKDPHSLAGEYSLGSHREVLDKMAGLLALLAQEAA